MKINERADNNQESECVPKPERAGAEAVTEVSSAEFIADSLAEIVEPDDISDAERKRTYKEEKQAVIHSLLAVVFLRRDIDFI